MRFELWEMESDDGTLDHEFFPADDEHSDWRDGVARRGLELTWSVEAADWDEAMTLLHVHEGLEPYKPMA